MQHEPPQRHQPSHGQRRRGQLKTAAQELSDLIQRYPELRCQVAAPLVVMMIQPALDRLRLALDKGGLDR
jgi:hypothetical protein